MNALKLIVLSLVLYFSIGSVSAQLKWKEYDGIIPSNAVIGGVENNEQLAICRCEYKGGTHPGKVKGSGCNIGWGGVERIVGTFEILVNTGISELDWLKVNGTLPEYAIKGGEDKGVPLYIGRSFHENGTHPGKILKVGGNYICNIGYKAKEITFSTYEVLVENHPHSNSETSILSLDEQCAGAGEDNPSIICDYLSYISKETKIEEGYSLVSNNIKFQTRVTKDGRLVIEEILDFGLCEDGSIHIFKVKEMWSHTTEKKDTSVNYYLKFQDDGNLCIYTGDDQFVWCSMSNDRNGHHFEITNIGHIEIVNDHGGEVWPD